MKKMQLKINPIAIIALVCWPNFAQAHSGLPPVVFIYPVGVFCGLLLAQARTIDLTLGWRKRLTGTCIALVLPVLLALPFLRLAMDRLFLSGLLIGGILSYATATIYFRKSVQHTARNETSPDQG